MEVALSVRSLAIVATLACAAPALAASIAYEGEDAVRLKCAAMLSLSSNFARSEGRLNPAMQAKSRAAVAQLLAPLPGTRADKARAMQAMADRIMLRAKPEALRAEFGQTLPACAQFF